MPASAPERQPVPVKEVPSYVFEEVYDGHFDFVWRSLRGIGVPEAHLGDVSQEVWVVVHRRLAGFEGRSSLRTWLFSISYRAYLGYRRKARWHSEVLELPSQRDERSTEDDKEARGPLEHAQEAEAAAFLRGFLSTQTQAKRDVFFLCAVEGWTAPEVSTALQVPLNTVYSRLRLARADFERSLDIYKRAQS